MEWKIKMKSKIEKKLSLLFVNLTGTLDKSGVSASFVELAWMSKERRQSSKLWEPWSFDVHNNAAVPMIVMLGCSKLDTEVSDAGMETAESDDCRGVSKKDGDANGVLATT